MSADAVAGFLLESLSARVLSHLGWRSASCVMPVLIRPRVKHAIEFFCGTGGLVAALSQSGLRCDWYDIVLDPTHDICSVGGMAAAVMLALSIVPGGFARLGVPCSTFVWIARGHTKRSPLAPLGDCGRGDVRRANRIVERVRILLRLMSMRDVFFILEQPAGSLLWRMPDIRLAARQYRVKGHRWARRFVWLGHFGHKQFKPTELCGVFPRLGVILQSKRPTRNTTTGVYKFWSDARGRRRVCGGPRLKATEHYPRAFCRAVAKLVRQRLLEAQAQ